MSVLSSFETSSSPAPLSSCRKKHIGEKGRMIRSKEKEKQAGRKTATG
jgi:hypothetical protein